jgi:hypothetical protein
VQEAISHTIHLLPEKGEGLRICDFHRVLGNIYISGREQRGNGFCQAFESAMAIRKSYPRLPFTVARTITTGSLCLLLSVCVSTTSWILQVVTSRGFPFPHLPSASSSALFLQGRYLSTRSLELEPCKLELCRMRYSSLFVGATRML